MIQQGPVQVFSLDLSLDVLKLEHLICIQLEQEEHCTDVVARFFLQMLHGQGPGFFSIPARNKSSQSKLAGNICSFVNHIKKSI